MSDGEVPESFKEKLFHALKSEAVLSERSKQLKKQVEDSRTREQMMHHLASELLERQRELNFMLNRASSVLHQLQDTNLALSAEFTHLVKKLPPAKDADWEDTIARVNELFKKTHELAGEMQEEILGKAVEPKPAKELADQAAVKAAAAAPPVSEPAPEAEYQLEPQAELVEPEPQLAAELELEPQAELAEPELQVTVVPEIGPEEPQEAEFEAVEEPAVEAEEEELVGVHSKFDYPRDDQVEPSFRLFQPVELKPAPHGRAQDTLSQGFLSRMRHRKSKQSV